MPGITMSVTSASICVAVAGGERERRRRAWPRPAPCSRRRVSTSSTSWRTAVLVLAQQQRLGPAERRLLAVLDGLRRRARPAAAGSRTVNVEPSPGSRADVDAPARLGDDPVHGREPEAGAEPDVLGREERLEDALEHGGLDARAGVARPPAARGSPCAPVSIASVPPSGIASRALIARLITTCSSCARSASTGGRLVAGEHRDLDVLADQPPEHRHQPARDLVEVEQDRLEHLPAREREQLAGELARRARPRAGSRPARSRPARRRSGGGRSRRSPR